MKSVLSGFRFGMVLQLAVGPVCVYVLKTAIEQGFPAGMLCMVGVVLVDGFYILLAGAGMAALLSKQKLQAALRIAGAIVLAAFGADMALSVVGAGFLPSVHLPWGGDGFIGVLLLTLSNPLTIVFWSGVFSARAADLQMQQGQVWAFGLGALLSTAVFLSVVSVVGSVSGRYLPTIAMQLLNSAVGLLLVFFAMRMLFRASKKRALPEEAQGSL